MTPKSSSSPPSSLVSVLALVVVALPAVIGIRHALPPNPVPASSPADVFSSERAMAHIRRIAERPHPTGSAEITAVRGFLAGALNGAGAAEAPDVTENGLPDRYFLRVKGQVKLLKRSDAPTFSVRRKQSTPRVST